MPKKAVAVFFLLAFLGAILFVYITFPRSKEEIPKSKNQRPFPSAPGPNNAPAPEPAPQPNIPKVQPGPTLRVMAWAAGNESKTLTALADNFGNATGRHVSLTIDGDVETYRHDLQAAMASGTPPDLCLIASRDFSGIDPRQFAAVTAPEGSAPRSIAAFTAYGEIKAVPLEYTVQVLYYNPSHFDQAGIGYPGPHWTWDILEADARALDALKIKDAQGKPTFPLELAADFDFWNILCSQAGQPALDLDVWHLGDAQTHNAQMHALDFIHNIFQRLTVTAPLPKSGELPGRLFAAQRSSLLIAPSNLTAVMPKFNYRFTLLPRDIAQASLAQVNGWAVPAASSQDEAARTLANYLAARPIHAGWNSVQKPDDDDSPAGICYQALGQSVVPRIEPKSQRMAQFLDQQINQLARNPQAKTDALYNKIQTEYQASLGLPPIFDSPNKVAPKASAAPQIRGP